MNALVPFAFGEHLVRSMLDENGNPWFVAKDVALALDYEWNGLARIAHVPEEWRRVTSVVTLRRGEQETWLLSEQGLYFFLGRSDKPKALPFQKWLAGDVLPALRKTGTYTLPGAAEAARPAPALPEVARRLKPAMRQRLWQDALQTARLDGEGSASAVAWFETLCRMMLLPCKPGQASEEVDRGVRAFARSACIDKAGKRVVASRMYAAFCRWWKENLASPIPSPSAFGNVMGGLVGKAKIGGRVFYLDVALLD